MNIIVWGRDLKKAKEEHLKLLKVGKGIHKKYHDACYRDAHAALTLVVSMRKNVANHYRRKR